MTYTSPFPAIEIPIASLHEHLFEHAHQWADKPALIDGPTGRHLTYTELRHAVAAVAMDSKLAGLSKATSSPFSVRTFQNTLLHSSAFLLLAA